MYGTTWTSTAVAVLFCTGQAQHRSPPENGDLRQSKSNGRALGRQCALSIVTPAHAVLGALLAASLFFIASLRCLVVLTSFRVHRQLPKFPFSTGQYPSLLVGIRVLLSDAVSCGV